MYFTNEDDGEGNEVQSTAQVDVQSLSLRKQLDMTLDMSDFSVPVSVSVAIGEWSRNWTFVQDSDPPGISIKQISEFSAGEAAPFATVLVEFTEPVVPIQKNQSLFCKAPIQPLSADYSVSQLLEDSDVFCGEDLSKRPMNSVVHVVGAQFRFHVGNSELPSLKLDILPEPHQEAIVTVYVRKGAVADYSGNLNEEAELVMHYKPSSEIHSATTQDTETERSAAELSQSVEWSLCRIFGFVMTWLIALSGIAALVSTYAGALCDISSSVNCVQRCQGEG